MIHKLFHIVSNNAWGGGEQYVYDLCRRQMCDGIEVSVFCRPVDTIITRFHHLGAPVFAARLGGVADLPSAWQLSRQLRRSAPCTVHAHNFKDAFTAAIARRLSGRSSEIRVVMCRHLTRTGKNTRLYRWLYRELDAICFDSELSRDVFLSTQPTIDTGKLMVVHTSIALPDSVPNIDVRKEFQLPADSVLAMYHGRLDAEKGLDVLLDAVGRIRTTTPYHLLLVGTGSDAYTAHLKQVIQEKKLSEHVLLAGFRHPVLPYVRRADFGILASTVREGCPLSPLEYMSQGRTVVATDNGGQREYLADGRNALLVSPGDAEALSKALTTLIEQPQLRQQLGSQAKADFDDHLHYEHFYLQLMKIYDDSL